MKDFNGYEFICANCGDVEDLYYAKDLADPDRHACRECGTVFWWSPVQQKLYSEETQAEIPGAMIPI